MASVEDVVDRGLASPSSPASGPGEGRLVGFRGRHLVSIDDFSRRELEYIVSASQRVKRIFSDDAPEILAERERLRSVLRGKVGALIQLEPSSRTFGSFKRAGAWLGAEFPFEIVDAKSSSFIKNALVADELRTFVEQHFPLRYLVMRSKVEGLQRFAADVLDEYCKATGRPHVTVFNAGDGTHEHPTQAILDMMSTMEYCGRLDNLKVVLQGDLPHSRTIHSFLKVLLKYPGNEFWLLSHPKFALPDAYKEMIQAAGSEFHEVDCYTRDLLYGKDVVYMSRPQAERFAQVLSDTEKDAYIRALTLRMEHIPDRDHCPFILHALPIDKTFIEVSKEVKKLYARFKAFDQAGNGTWSRTTELLLFLGVLGWGDELPLYVHPHEIGHDVRITKKDVPYDRDRLRHHIIGPIRQGWVFDHIPDDYRMFMKAQEILGPPSHGMCDGRVELEKKESRKMLGSDFKYLIKRDHDIPEERIKRVLELSSHIRANKVVFRGDTVEYTGKDGTTTVREVGAVTEKWAGRLPEVSTNVYVCQNVACVSRLDEEADSVFHLVDPKKGLYRCAYDDSPLLTSNARFR